MVAGRGEDERVAIGKARLIRVLRNHIVATARTLEQKISDAGPNHMRVDPHILTVCRNTLVKDKVLAYKKRSNARWYYLSNTPALDLQRRLAEQEAIFNSLQKNKLGMRIGQALEIATYRALCEQQGLTFFGSFPDLGDHDDSRLCTKEEPPSHIGNKTIPGKQRLDFLVHHSGLWAGIELKNIREWLYPDRDEVKDFLQKCIHLHCVPVLIGRRLPFVTFKLLRQCGVVLHQTYNQLMPAAEEQLAAKAKDKALLGYHDIRLGNQPDNRLLKFLHHNLPAVLPKAQQLFDDYRDLVSAYAFREIPYEEFAARVRRRSLGQNEDSDFPEDFYP